MLSTPEIKEKLLTDNNFVVSELKKVQVLYELKKVIRYNHSREHEEHTESVAEHIFGMHCLVDYFLPLENPEGNWDLVRIKQLAQYHDIDEIETGDFVSQWKTTEQIEAGRSAFEKVIAETPDSLQPLLNDLTREYEEQKTDEARFVKAIDKIEPIFHLYCAHGKATLATLQTTKDEHDRVKHPYVNNFPVIKRFAEVMTERFEKEGFYHR